MQQEAGWHNQQVVPIPQLQQHSAPKNASIYYRRQPRNFLPPATSAPTTTSTTRLQPPGVLFVSTVSCSICSERLQPSFDQLPCTIRHNQTDLLLSTPSNLQSIGVNHSSAKSVKKTYTTQHKLQTHTNAKHPTCSLCGQRQLDQVALDAHLLQEHSRCEHCFQWFWNLVVKNDHISQAHFLCKFCKQIFDNLAAAQKHEHKKHPCCFYHSLCGFQAQSPTLKKHQEDQHESCTLCSFWCYDSTQLTEHSGEVHYFCDICQLYHRNEQEYREKHCKCPFCQQQMWTSEELETHLHDCHPLCPTCQQRKSTQGDLDRHKSRNHPYCKRSSCKHRGRFQDSQALRTHRRDYHGGH